MDWTAGKAIRELSDYKNKVNQIISAFHGRSPYLKQGSYILDGGLLFLYRKDKNTINTVKNVFLKDNYYPKTALGYREIGKKMIVSKPIKCQNLNGETSHKFNGTVYLMSNTNQLIEARNIKIFDFDSMEVMTLFADGNGFEKKLVTYEYFKSYFAIPRILSHDFENKIVIEELIKCKPREEWDDADYNMIIEELFNKFKAYYTDCRKNGEYLLANIRRAIEKIKHVEALCSAAERFQENIPEDLLDMAFPTVKGHGDVWLYNILLNADSRSPSVYLIDWEYVGEHFVLFDLLYWLHVEIIYNNDYSFMEKYLRGEYDKHFEDIFEIFGMKFDKKLRVAYYSMVILELLDCRMISKAHENIQLELKMHLSVIEKVNNIMSHIKTDAIDEVIL